MKRLFTLSLAIALAACGEAGPILAKPSNASCAAHLSATSFAISQGEISVEDSYANDAYIAMMWHINAWAVPRNISEAEAFEQVKREAETLRETKSAAQLLEVSRWCIKNRPKQ